MIRRILLRIGIGLAAVIAAAAALVLILLAFYAGAVYLPPSGEISGRIVSGGQERAYVLHVPKNYDPSIPVPLVISLHGFAEWPAHQMEISRWNDLADREGFLVVYPAGTGFPLRWRLRGDATNPDLPMTDVRFISDLIDRLMQEYRIDPARVYANGLSNGGGMSDVLACTLADRIAAIGGVSGAYLFPRDECRPPRAVPVIAFHGTDDPIVPYPGGELDILPRALSAHHGLGGGMGGKERMRKFPRSPAAGRRSHGDPVLRLPRQQRGNPLYRAWRRTRLAGRRPPAGMAGRPDDAGYRRHRRDVGIFQIAPAKYQLTGR